MYKTFEKWLDAGTVSKDESSPRTCSYLADAATLRPTVEVVRPIRMGSPPTVLPDLITPQCDVGQDDARITQHIIQARRKQSHNRRSFEVRTEVGEIVFAELQRRGHIYRDGAEAYYFDTGTHVLTPIRPDGQEIQAILARWGLLSTDSIYPHVVEYARLHSLADGSPVTVRRFARYDEPSNRLYIDAGGGRIIKIGASTVNVVDNGTDGVLFPIQSGMAQWPALAQPPDEVCVASALTQGFNFDEDVLNASEQKTLILLWYLSLFFQELMPTRPILCVIGPMGSGKSFLLRRMGRYLFGPGFNTTPLPNRSDDFDALLSNSSFVALDNADDRSPVWLANRLATAATGGAFGRREYFTTNRAVEYPIVARVAITSRNPDFTREDVASRLLPIRLVAIEDSNIPESQLLAATDAGRNAVVEATAWLLSEILVVLPTERAESRNFTIRMADFASFASAVGRMLFGEEGPARIQELLGRLASAQQTFTSDGDDLVQIIEIWVREAGHAETRFLPNELVEQFRVIAGKHNLRFACDRGQDLTKQLEQRRGYLERVFGMSRPRGGGHRRYICFSLPKEGGDQ